ncbi:MAG: cell division protein FtsL [Acidobacteriaceae bacterium]
MATMVMAGQQIGETQGGTGARRSLSVAEQNRALFEQQRARRRGPTPEMFFAKHIDNSRLVKEDDPERRRDVRRFTITMTLFFLLMMVYVWQHFSAIEVGYRVEAQKTQVEMLQEQNRQLELTEAQLSDPQRIDRIAKQLGMESPQPGQVVRADGMGGTPTVMAQAKVPVLAGARTGN